MDVNFYVTKLVNTESLTMRKIQLLPWRLIVIHNSDLTEQILMPAGAWSNLYSTHPLSRFYIWSLTNHLNRKCSSCDQRFFCSSLRNLIPTKTVCDSVILWQAVGCLAAKFRFYQEPFDKRITKSKCVCVGESKVYPGSSNFIPLNLIFSSLKKYIVLIFCRAGYRGHFSHKLRSWTDCLVSTAQGK